MNDELMSILFVVGMAFTIFGFVGIGICFGPSIIAFIAGTISFGVLSIIIFLLGLLIFGIFLYKL